MGRLIDISPLVDADTAVFPGDVPLSRDVLMDMKRGDAITLSTMRCTVHCGAHADAPSHYTMHGATIERQPLDLYIGRCNVLATRARLGAALRPEDIVGEVEGERVLFKTETWPDRRVFNAEFASLSIELIDLMQARGVRLVGVDTPSVDRADAKDLVSHHALSHAGISILECLDLSKVDPGVYELIALPLRLAGFDASPVRAVLRELDQDRRPLWP